MDAGVADAGPEPTSRDAGKGTWNDGLRRGDLPQAVFVCGTWSRAFGVAGLQW